jgi:hypothetical protein
MDIAFINNTHVWVIFIWWKNTAHDNFADNSFEAIFINTESQLNYLYQQMH